MSGQVKTLCQIVEFCNHKALEPIRHTFPFPSEESDLYNWIESTIRVLLETVIPKSFWQSYLSAKASKIVRFSQMPGNPTEVVLMLILWASWSQDCLEEIVKCLEFAAYGVKSRHLEWACSFSYCIALNLQYSAFSLPRASKLSFKGRVLFLESICLRQVVSSSSCLFQTFDNLEYNRKTVEEFSKELPTNKLMPEVSHEFSVMYPLTKEGKDRFTLVSIVDWFKRSKIIPILQKILDLKPIQQLINDIKEELNKKDENQVNFSNSVGKHTEKAADQLHISTKQSGTLVAFVMTSIQFVTQHKSTPMLEEKDKLLLRLFAKILLPCLNQSNLKLKLELKRIVQEEQYFLSDFVGDFIGKRFELDDNDWCNYLKFANQQRNNSVKDRTQESVSLAVKNNPKKKRKSSILEERPLTALVQNTCPQANMSKRPASSLKENMSPRKASLKKNVSFSKQVIQGMKSGDLRIKNFPKRRLQKSPLSSGTKVTTGKKVAV